MSEVDIVVHVLHDVSLVALGMLVATWIIGRMK
jgi:hypothetical protein